MPEFAALSAESPSTRAEHFAAVLEDSQATLARDRRRLRRCRTVATRGMCRKRQRRHGATLGAGGDGVCTLRDAASDSGRLDRLLPMDYDVSEYPLTASRALGRRADHGLRTLLETTDRKVERNEPIGAAVRAKDQGVAHSVMHPIPSSVRKGTDVGRLGRWRCWGNTGPNITVSHGIMWRFLAACSSSHGASFDRFEDAWEGSIPSSRT
jgi:hypothetical protein